MSIITRDGTMDSAVVAEIDSDVYGCSNLLRPGDVVFDVGAYIGDFSSYVSRACPCIKVYAFEPIKRNFEMLKKNAPDDAVLLPYAIVGNNRDVVIFDFGDESSACHSVYDMGCSNSVETHVQGRTLESIMNEYNVDNIRFLKLDCQGAEYDIIYHCPAETLKMVDYIGLEVHEHIANNTAVLGSIPNAHLLRSELIKRLMETHLPIKGNILVDSIQVWQASRLMSLSRRLLIRSQLFKTKFAYALRRWLIWQRKKIRRKISGR